MTAIDQHVPTSAHYDAQYLSHGRAFSIAAQIASIMELAPRNAALRDAGFARVHTFRVREIAWHRFLIADIA
jgi:hypothetical protein